MSGVMYRLNRYRDISGVSGEGDEKATVVEFSSGLSVLHWNSDKPSIQVHTDIRHITDLHGHSGASELVLYDNERLVAAYKQVMFWMLSASEDSRPMSVDPHPEWPDRLLCRFRDEASWRLWVALMDGSTYAASHEERRGQLVTTWVTPDGGVWLQWARDGSFEALLDGETYDEYPNSDPYDPRD